MGSTHPDPWQRMQQQRNVPFDGITLNNFIIIEYSGPSVGEICMDDIRTDDDTLTTLRPGEVIVMMKSQTLENSLNRGTLHWYLYECQQQPLCIYDIVRMY